jgi:molybdate transport system permease protein
MLAGNIPGRTQTVAVAIYDAVESGNGALARALVLIVSAVSIAILWFANHFAASPFGEGRPGERR